MNNSNNDLLQALLPVLPLLSKFAESQAAPPPPTQEAAQGETVLSEEDKHKAWFSQQYGIEFDPEMFGKFVEWTKNPPDLVHTMQDSYGFLERVMGGSDKIPKEVRSKYAQRAYESAKGTLNDLTDDITPSTFFSQPAAKRAAEEITPSQTTTPSPDENASAEKKQKTPAAATPAPPSSSSSSSITEEILNLVTPVT